MKLHTDEADNVWYALSDGPPTNSKKALVPFLLTRQSDFPTVRMIGSHKNCQLILGMYQKRLQRGSGCVEVCTPSVCKTAAELKDPYAALAAMRRLRRSASIGGWHLVARNDYVSYAIVSGIQKIGEYGFLALVWVWHAIGSHPSESVTALATCVIAWFTIVLARATKSLGISTTKVAEQSERTLVEIQRAFVFVKEIN